MVKLTLSGIIKAPYLMLGTGSRINNKIILGDCRVFFFGNHLVENGKPITIKRGKPPIPLALVCKGWWDVIKKSGIARTSRNPKS
jgi:hypothetical protein